MSSLVILPKHHFNAEEDDFYVTLKHCLVLVKTVAVILNKEPSKDGMNNSLNVAHNQLTLRLLPRRWWCPLILSHLAFLEFFSKKKMMLWALCGRVVERS